MDGKQVVTSYEIKVNHLCSNGRYWCWAIDEEGPIDQTVRETLKQRGGPVMIWGCMSAIGLSFICKIEGRLNQYLS